MSLALSFLQTVILVIETAVKHRATVFPHSKKLVLFCFSAEIPISYSEEEFTSPVAQDPTDLIEDTQVTTTKVAVTEAEAGDTELECASEKQCLFPQL